MNDVGRITPVITRRVYFDIPNQGGIWLTLSREDAEALYNAMFTDEEVTLRDVDSGIAFAARRRDCGDDWCNCWAEIVSPRNIRQLLEGAA